MAALYDLQPLNDAEKIFVLAEILKRHTTHPEQLLRVVNGMLGQQQPAWNDIPLPPGRSLNSCMRAFDNLRATSGMQPTQMIQTTRAPQSTSPMSAPISMKRPFPFEGTGSFSAGREIRPKPSPSINPYGQQSPLEQQHRKKRGRPTKLEQQARAEAQGVGAAPGPAPRPMVMETPTMRPPVAQPAPESLSIEPPRPEETRPPPIPRMQISSMLTPTGQKSNSQSSSSSGKRRRGRSTRSEPEDLPQIEGSTAPQAQEYESPYARMGAEAPVQDSPARAAVLRHRDDPDPQPASTSAQETSSITTPTTTGT